MFKEVIKDNIVWGLRAALAAKEEDAGRLRAEAVTTLRPEYSGRWRGCWNVTKLRPVGGQPGRSCDCLVGGHSQCQPLAQVVQQGQHPPPLTVPCLISYGVEGFLLTKPPPGAIVQRQVPTLARRAGESGVGGMTSQQLPWNDSKGHRPPATCHSGAGGTRARACSSVVLLSQGLKVLLQVFI